MDKLIITAALTGGVTLPTQTPYLPITPEEIAEEAYKVWEAGASIVHIHARDPKTGKPTPDLDVFRDILTRIKSRCDIVACITTGGALGMPREDRIAVVPTFKPEMATFNMGSMNFGIHPILSRFKEFKYDWEPKYALASKDAVFRNTFEDIEYFCKTMLSHQVKPELEIYDAGHLYNTAYLLRNEILKPPLHIQFVMGVLGGIGAALEDLIYLKQTADRLIGAGNYTWSVIGVGYRAQFQLSTLSIMMGGHVRVGMEDNIYIQKGVFAKSNAEVVSKVVRIAKEFDREVATPSETRQMLGLKGLDKVNY